MKKIGPASGGIQIAFSFAVFTLTAIFLLTGSFERPLEILHNFIRTASVGGALVSLAAGVCAWLICLLGLILMWRMTNALSDNLQFVFTRYLLLVFLVFFSAERATDSLARWLRLARFAFVLPSIQVLSSIGVAIGAAIVLPRLRSIREGSALALKEHARFVAAAENTLDDFYIFDGIPGPDGSIVDFRFSYINPNAERRLNVQRDQLVGKVLTEVRPFMISSGLIVKYREVVRTGVPFTTEVFIDDEMIKATWLNVQVVKLGDGIAITSRDITEHRRLTDRIHYLAHYDQLTGLANRTLLQDRLQQAIVRAQRQNQKVAIFVLDIDYFKRVNDSLGHADGDALLAAFGQRLRSSVRETDTVARLGGDEFVIVMPDVKSLEEVRLFGQKIVQSASKPIVFGDREIRITVSLGVCTYPDCGLEPDKLLRGADAAMYRIKDAGRNGLHIFDEDFLDED